MSLRITDDCINCGSCEEACPTEAITEDETANFRVIDPSRCTECVGFYNRTMCQVECPVECCVLDTEHEETAEALLEKAQALAPERDFSDPPPSHFR